MSPDNSSEKSHSGNKVKDALSELLYQLNPFAKSRRGEGTASGTNALSRRKFLKITGAAAALTAAAAVPGLVRADESGNSPESGTVPRNIFKEFVQFRPDARVVAAKGRQLPEGFPMLWAGIDENRLGSLRSPLEGTLMGAENMQFDVEREQTHHYGIDIYAYLNQTITCPIDGTYYDGWDTESHQEENPNGGSGRMSIVESKDPIWLGKDERGVEVPYYLTIILGHVKKDCKVVDANGYQIHDGATVQAGDDAGNIGLTGNTSADEPHLHFEMRIGKKLPIGFGGSPIEFPEDSVPVDPTDLWMHLQRFSKTPPPKRILPSKAEILR